MRFNTRHKATTKEKIAFIQNLLSGVIDISQYRAPKSYQVFREKEDEYNITDLLSANKEVVVLNQEQYDNWKATLGEQDVLFCIDFFSYADPVDKPIEETNANELLAKYEAERNQNTTSPLPTVEPKTEPIESPNKGLKRDPTEPRQTITIKDEVFVMPRSGKLSQYGETWRIKDN